jgi:hypothetical protein
MYCYIFIICIFIRTENESLKLQIEEIHKLNKLNHDNNSINRDEISAIESIESMTSKHLEVHRMDYYNNKYY